MYVAQKFALCMHLTCPPILFWLSAIHLLVNLPTNYYLSSFSLFFDLQNYQYLEHSFRCTIPRSSSSTVQPRVLLSACPGSSPSVLADADLGRATLTHTWTQCRFYIQLPLSTLRPGQVWYVISPSYHGATMANEKTRYFGRFINTWRFYENLSHTAAEEVIVHFSASKAYSEDIGKSRFLIKVRNQLFLQCALNSNN